MKTEKQMRVIFAGCGGIANAWMKACIPFDDMSVQGLMDIRFENATAFKERHKLTQAQPGDNLATMIRELKPDAVFDCSLPSTHHDVTLQALELGCHVLGEKPMSDNMKDAREMVEAAVESAQTGKKVEIKIS